MIAIAWAVVFAALAFVGTAYDIANKGDVDDPSDNTDTVIGTLAVIAFFGVIVGSVIEVIK